MKKFLLVALTAVGLTACVQNEELAVNKPTAAITFADSFVNSTTRAESPVITSTNLTGFDVWAFMDQATGTVLTDEDVVKNESTSTWGYNNIQYWFPSHTYYFAALAPMNSANITSKTLATADDAKLGLGEIAFTNVDGTEDLLYAKTIVETPEIVELTNSGMDAVNMQFQHLLSKVRFTFTNGFLTNNVKVRVTNVKMTAPKSATINLAQDTYNNAWVLDQDELTLDFGDVPYLGATQSKSAANERFSIPATDAYNYNVTFDVKVYSGDVLAYELSKDAVIEGYALEMGKSYNFTAVLDHESLNLHAIEFTAEVDEWVDANNPETEVPVLDYYYDSTTGEALVTSAQGLQAIADDINSGALPAEIDVTLNNDVDLATLAPVMRSTTEYKNNWNPIGSFEKPFTGTFDGNGYTIKNLTLVEDEAKEGKAYIGFFGYAKDATIKNVTFENVYINIPCLDIDHSQGHIGAVAGSLEGKSTIENVTVKGKIEIYTTQAANGASRVAVIAGGNAYGDVTMNNVHVIASEGSSLIANNNVGALAGQLQGKMYFENCTSNINVTANKFFAGGLVGIAAGDSYIKNCHTTGDVAVVAGREGRHNDEYRVGGIAGGWADGKTKVFTLEGCTYTGTITGKNSDGVSEANPLDYMGYVGRGYTLSNCAGSKVIIDGVEYVQAYDDVYGIYTIDGVYEMKTLADMQWLANKVNTGADYFEGKTIKLANDIDLNNVEWTPIGSAYKDHGFMGNFDGNGKTIKNLSIKNITPDSDGYVYAGLFGVTEGTDKNNQNYIKNLTIENVKISTEGHIVAAAIAYPYYTNIENITVKGDINIKGGDYTAGVLAYTRRCVDAKNLTIAGNTGSSITGNSTIGGVISDIQMNGGLTANYSNFAASGLTIQGVKCVGGISGIISMQTLDGATVKNVTIVSEDNRTGIVSGADGGKSTITNVSYENVTGATRVIGATYDKGYYIGQIVECAGQKAIIYSINDGVKAVSVEEKNLKGKTASDAATWAEELGEGWSLASIYDLDAIHEARFALNDALEADSADNALFCETDYYTDGKYALYVSSTATEGNDPQGEAYFANRVHLKYFNLNGYWDYPYSTFATINKSAPLKDNYFARAVYNLSAK